MLRHLALVLRDPMHVQPGPSRRPAHAARRPAIDLDPTLPRRQMQCTARRGRHHKHCTCGAAGGGRPGPGAAAQTDSVQLVEGVLQNPARNPARTARQVAGDLDPALSQRHLTTLKRAYLKLRFLVDAGCVLVGHGLKTDLRMLNIAVPPAQARRGPWLAGRGCVPLPQHVRLAIAAPAMPSRRGCDLQGCRLGRCMEAGCMQVRRSPQLEAWQLLVVPIPQRTSSQAPPCDTTMLAAARA
jgi:hypothetical protein